MACDRRCLLPSGRWLPALGLAVVLSGCAAVGLPRPGRDAQPGAASPEEWTRAEPSNRGPVGTGWLSTLGDPDLEALVEEALARNRNLRSAAARLRVVREGMILGRAGRLPTLGAGMSVARSETAFREGRGDLGPFNGVNDYRLSLNAAWEVDLWGRLANLHRASQADYESERADFRAARLSLAANTIKAWCNVTAARLQVELSEQTRESFDRNQRIVERNYKAGDITASPLDVQFARNQLASTERGLISQRLALEEARRSLELLLGRYPAASVNGRQELPSDLLMRRPDLISAAAALRASAERADAARKGLLPAISLSAAGASGASGASVDLLDLVANPAYLAGNVAASLGQPLYRGGALKAQAKQSLALNEAAIESFAGIALRAFREVESALAAEHSLAQQYAFLETEVRQANLAEIQATRDYSEGIVGYLSVLEAQRRAFNARSAMISLRNTRIQTRIDLHLALGGDFADPPADPSKLSRAHD
jgi:multidrug efflux system outer membrane protein